MGIAPEFILSLSEISGSECRMMPPLKSIFLMIFFVVSGVAAVATHVWRQRVEAEFDPKPLYEVISRAIRSVPVR